jgi:hypothetical protein
MDLPVRYQRWAASRQGAVPGERTDILVQAIVPGTQDGDASTIGVVIEIKGCWNDELMAAMDTQLTQRYLASLPGYGGLYLVGCFDCAVWPVAGDRRCQHASRAQLQVTLHQQAAGLSDSQRPIRSAVLDVTLQ